MAARDRIHGAVKNALIKDDWQITHDPFALEYKGDKLYADLAAERPLTAHKAGQVIVVEIKSFLRKSPIQDFKEALGQYILYRDIINEQFPTYKLYLAVSTFAYQTAFQRPVIQWMIERYTLSLLIVDVETEEVHRWIN